MREVGTNERTVMPATRKMEIHGMSLKGDRFYSSVVWKGSGSQGSCKPGMGGLGSGIQPVDSRLLIVGILLSICIKN